MSDSPQTPPEQVQPGGAIPQHPPESSGLADAPIVLPAPPQAADDRLHTRRSQLLRGVLYLLALLLACLLASFAIRNSAVWLHLATGRALLEGTYTFGHDPFGYTTAHLYWVNASWLFDLLSYGLYVSCGGAALTVCRCLLLVALALVLLQLARRGTSAWLPAATTFLALVALGPWLDYRPLLISYLFLGLFLWFLQRGTDRQSGDTSTPRTFLDALHRAWAAWWPLLVLQVLWANLDAWFILGPIVAALYGLGQGLQGNPPGAVPQTAAATQAAVLTPAHAPRKLDFLWLLLLIALAALLNPHHYRIYRWPTELGLSPAVQQLQQDPALDNLVISPFSSAYLHSPAGHSPATLAYWLLLGLSALALLWNFRSLRRADVLLWLAFALLSVYQARTIAFFAIVAAPLTARNFQAAWATHVPMRRARAVPGLGESLGNALTVLAGVVLVILAWPGWLQQRVPEPPRWTLEVDEALRQAAEQVRDWRSTGKLAPGAHLLAFRPEAAHYLAWFCPGEQSFLDGRFLLSTEAAQDYRTLRRAFLEDAADTGPSAEETQAILTRWNIQQILVQAREPQEILTFYQNTAPQPNRWPLLYLHGRVLIFGRPGPAKQTIPRLNLEQRAFSAPQAQTAPRNGVAASPMPRAWWTAFYQYQPRPALASAEAGVYLLLFQAEQPRYLRQQSRLWHSSLLAGLPLVPASTPMPLTAPMHLALQWQLVSLGPDFYLSRQERGPPAWLYLAVRAGRQAVAAVPDDAGAWLMLGQSYVQLTQQTREQVWIPQFAALGRIRTVQTITAFRQALQGQPDLAQAHLSLSELYLQMDFQDLALDHASRALEILRRAGPPAGEPRPHFAERLEQWTEQVNQLRQEVQRREKQYQDLAPGLNLVGQAHLAGKCGLARKALDMLLASDLAVFGAEGMYLELSLLLVTGEASQVRGWLEPQHAHMLGDTNYHWLLAQAAAAQGDYAEADQHLKALLPLTLRLPDFTPRPLSLSQGAALLLGQALLDQAPSASLKFSPRREKVVQDLRQLSHFLQEQANQNCLRGLLALEAGDIAQSRQLFQEVQRVARAAHSEDAFQVQAAAYWLTILERAAE